MADDHDDDDDHHHGPRIVATFWFVVVVVVVAAASLGLGVVSFASIVVAAVGALDASRFGVGVVVAVVAAATTSVPVPRELCVGPRKSTCHCRRHHRQAGDCGFRL